MLNENIKALRKARSLSQEELAARLNVVRQTVSKWEQGLSVPDAGMLTRLAEALETTTSHLLGETIEEPAEEETIAALAQKLAQLNEQYAAEQERRRKRWRIACIVVTLLVLFSLLRELLGVIHAWQANVKLTSNQSIIGGADAAAHIYLSAVQPHWLSILLTFMAGAAALAGLHRTRRQ